MTFKAVCKYSVCEVSCLGFGLDLLVRLSAPVGLAGFSKRRGTKNQLFSLLPCTVRRITNVAHSITSRETSLDISAQKYLAHY